jgi:hypothetical protein
MPDNPVTQEIWTWGERIRLDADVGRQREVLVALVLGGHGKIAPRSSFLADMPAALRTELGPIVAGPAGEGALWLLTMTPPSPTVRVMVLRREG